MQSLSDYYSSTILLNESGKGGWASIYYGIFSNIINEYKYKTVAEVGIGYGTHAKQVLKNTSIEKIYLIDPMKYYPNDRFANDIMNTIPIVPNNQFNELYDHINTYLSDDKEKVVWFRKESTSVTMVEIPDQSLDCVFIDGNHEYQYVLDDLYFWSKKVRPGGQILGDDYWMSDVSRAVHDFEKNSNKSVDFLTLPNSDYKIYRFHI
jgi:hypothetical protein